MITVKGTKSDPVQNDPATRYQLALDPRKSRVPYMIGGLVAAVTLYIKSATRGQAEPAYEGQADAPQQDDGTTGSAPGSVAAAGNATRTLTDSAEFRMLQAMLPQSARAVSAMAAAVPVADAPSGDSPFGAAPIDFGATRPVPATRAPNVADPADAATGKELAAAQTGASGRGGGAAAGGGDAADPRNRAPKATRQAVLADAGSGMVMAIALADLLDHITDADGDRLSVENAKVSAGTLVEVEGGYLYRADPDVEGTVEMTFDVSDGRTRITQVAQFDVVANRMNGTEVSETITGGPGRDAITGGAGNDTIAGMGGNDTIEGGAGDDMIDGGAGNDRIFGHAGNDILRGGEGRDHIEGGDGDDIIAGDAGDDTLLDGHGLDTVSGGSGDDLIVASLDGQDDHFDGGEGRDTLDLSNAIADLRIDLFASRATGIDIGNDTFTNFETVLAGSGNDLFVIGSQGMVMAGGSGDNIFEFTDLGPPGTAVQTMHQILDFNTGDLIRAASFDIFSKPDEVDLFDTMNDPGNTAQARIRYYYEEDDDDDDGNDRTVLELDNEDHSYVTVVMIDGRHVLVWNEYEV